MFLVTATAVLAFCVSVAPALASPTTFYVAPNDSDGNVGTLQAPFATLERARAAVRPLVKAGLKRDVRVVLRFALRHAVFMAQRRQTIESGAFSQMRELVRLQGDEGQPVRNLHLRGLTFTHGDRDVWTKNDAGLQHDCEMHDKGNVLVRLRGAEGCVVERCLLENSAGGAPQSDGNCVWMSPVWVDLAAS